MLKFHVFHLMPYAYADMDFRAAGYPSLWLVRPHDDFDPEKGAELYARYLDELGLADELGFDGVCVNEHHQTPYSMMPSPDVIAGALTQRTKRAKILILGRALPIVANPLTVAEEFAMLDNMSRGRIICGFVRGIGTEYHASGVNPVHSVERFREAHEIIVRAWTERGPFSYEGQHYRFSYLNLFPKPYQKPHPPIWIPSSGSDDTLEWAATHRYTYLQFFSSPYEALKRNLARFRVLARQAGYEAADDQLGWAVPTYVAETDAIARREAGPHLENLFNNFLAQTPEMLLPPGYVSLEAARARAQAGRGGLTGTRNRTLDELIESGVALIGSAAFVRDSIARAKRETGLGHLLPLLHFGTLPADLTRGNIQRFAAEIMEPLRREFNR
jgi:alkanesulfonate monooxygenase SsuD/methylene tetrahydromethanopterin reductase-like flavin-dependent oxidoreductase (luciferase family)